MGRHLGITAFGNYNWNDIGINSEKHINKKQAKITIREASTGDSAQLTEIAFNAKRHWNYPEAYFEIWKKELTITHQYIDHNPVFKAILNDEVVGFLSLTYVPRETYNQNIKIEKGWWLEHLFVLPKFHHLKIGSQLIDFCKKMMKKEKIPELSIFVDPFATGFYEKIGAHFAYISPSSIEGRELPVYKMLGT